ncbi:hypothetical protein [Streptomyces botrytidirepellens]|uniref:Uncharacterized protein n=1 Tax=Streptomyces botrytidirepellens TaxID=2486417 RepID=A0A3M8WVY7_9ACTN|nr:hypothetical protein [Streptomyces botrytidirepellens]RNG33574.1 hypothetical protein EEJ42_07165 [Streptomyces botrytidirepellens]
MTILTRERLFTVSLHLRQGGAQQAKAIMLCRDGDRFIATYDSERASLHTAAVLARVILSSEGITITEVILEGHDPDLTALYRAASKLLLDVEITTEPRITEPTVRVLDQDPTQATYFVPEGWDLTDALSRLPAAFAAARPKVARNLERIEQAKKDSGGKIDHVLGLVAVLVLKTDDPDGVYDEVLHLLRQVPAKQTTVGARAAAA